MVISSPLPRAEAQISLCFHLSLSYILAALAGVRETFALSLIESGNKLSLKEK